MSRLMEKPFSDLVNRPVDTVAALTRSPGRTVRLRRRDAEDLVLVLASRYEQDHAVIAAAVRLLVALMRAQDPPVQDILVGALPEIFPWVHFLPPDDQHEFLSELVSTLRAAEDLDNLAPVAQLITEWRHTAEVHADPDTAAALTRDADDHGQVSEPGVAG